VRSKCRQTKLHFPGRVRQWEKINEEWQLRPDHQQYVVVHAPQSSSWEKDSYPLTTPWAFINRCCRMTTEATGNKHTVVEQYAVYYVITMTDHSNSRCCNPRFIHSSHNLHIKQQRLQFMQCTSSHGKHASVFRPSKLIYICIYI